MSELLTVCKNNGRVVVLEIKIPTYLSRNLEFTALMLFRSLLTQSLA